MAENRVSLNHQPITASDAERSPMDRLECEVASCL